MQEHGNHDHGDRGAETRSSTTGIPSWLYRVLIGIVAWFALAAWIFAGPGSTDYLLVIVSGFIFSVLALQFILSRVDRGERAESADERPPFRDRHKWDFDIFQTGLASAKPRRRSSCRSRPPRSG